MYTATVTAKGQITIPSEVRKAMRLTPGSKILIFRDSEGDFILRTKTGSIMDLRGCLAGYSLPKTDDEMYELLHGRAAELDNATKSGTQEASEGEAA